MKGVVTEPYTLMDWSFNEYYADRRTACVALAYEMRNEVAALAAAGAKIIQIDEPALSVRPDELPLAREAMCIVTEGIEASDKLRTMMAATRLVRPTLSPGEAGSG
ncbi:MAG: hypothetical protein ACE5I7_02930 [Candidatus Binatia bacterium]